MATIRDVAQRAGVSVQTVSNVLHEKAFVKPETQLRVRQVIEELNYHPSRVAQGMRRQSSQTIGFFVSDPSPRSLADPFHGEVMAGISDAARSYGYSLLIDRPEIDDELPAQNFLNPFLTRRVDAAVITLTGVTGRHAAIVDELVRAEVPFAILEQDAAGQNAYSVQGANYEGAHLATMTLLEQGHQRVAFLDSAQMWPAVDQRYRGYEAAMRERGFARQMQTLTSPNWTVEGGAVAMTRLLDSGKPRPTAVLAGNDVLAIGAMHAIRAKGLRIPGDVAVIGFDDFEFAHYVDPPLSTVRLPAYDMGRRAAEVLIDHLQGKAADERRIVLSTELILRQST